MSAVGEKAKVQKVRLGIFGVGMHFQETYSKALKRSEINALVDVPWVTDLESKKELVLTRCAAANQSPRFIGVEKFKGIVLPSVIKKKLDQTVRDYPVDAILVSTTPEQHRAYAEWALSRNIPIIIDKPVVARANAVRNTTAAAGILEDWQALNRLATNKHIFAVVNSHRRFHPAYLKVCELLSEVAEETGIGVTSLASFNSDGQWRLPQELQDIHYHGYENGNGVLSHFGYHYLDLAMLWYMNGTPPERRANKLRASSSFSTAQNYSSQINTNDAARALRRVSQPEPKNNDQKVRDNIKEFGEVDAFCSIEMWKDDNLTAHIGVQLLHSGFSQRAWTKPAENLYKENGRVRWENHLIQQGPFQAIEVRSFQAVQPNWKKPDQNIPRWELGGADHLEINVYRNLTLGKPVLETINCKDLITHIPPNDVIHEDAKANALLYFVCAVAIKKHLPIANTIRANTRKQVDKLLKGSPYDFSILQTHQATNAALAASYQSYATRTKNPAGNERVEKEIVW